MMRFFALFNHEGRKFIFYPLPVKISRLNTDTESVSRKTSCDTSSGEIGPQPVCDAFDRIVSEITSKNIVYHLEISYIHKPHHIFLLTMGIDELLNSFIKVFTIIKSCKAVMSRTVHLLPKCPLFFSIITNTDKGT